jgi:PAS domain S-box-containing protein
MMLSGAAFSGSGTTSKDEQAPPLPLADRLQQQNRVIVSLIKRKLNSKDDFLPACREISENSAKALHVARSGIWLFSDIRDRVRCIARYEAGSNDMSGGDVLFIREFPAFFRALDEERIISANNCLNDSRTRELAAAYLIPHGITSLLCAPVWFDGSLAGLFTQENIGPPRAWSYDEQHFISSLADIIALALDVCRLRDAEERLAERVALLDRERAFFRKVIDMAPNFIFAKDRNGRYVLANKAAAEAYGTTVEQLLGRTDAEINSQGEIVERIVRDDREVMDTKTGRIHTDEVFTDCKGNVRILQTVKLPMVDEMGAANHILAVSTDITERKKAEEARERLLKQMQHAQQLESLGILAGGIAHDFNNLLMAILGSASLIVEELPERSPLRSRVQTIINAGKRASELTNQLLAYSGRGQFYLQPVNISHLVEDIVPLLRTFVSSSVELDVAFGPATSLIYADSAQLRQTVLHLVANSVDSFEGQAGTISIKTMLFEADESYLNESRFGDQLASGTYVLLEVSDTGCGIPEAILDRIFDPFFSTKFTGRGLGLAAVSGIVRSHRGALHVTSRPGAGTSIALLFPRYVPAAESMPTAPVAAQSPQPAKTALVVDDEHIVRGVAKEMLQRLGYTVVEAESGKAAVQIFREQQQDIAFVLLDMTMPEMDGLETLKALQEIRREVPVLLSSGYSEQEVSSRFSGTGVAGFIQKPYSNHLLERKLRGIAPLPPKAE